MAGFKKVKLFRSQVVFLGFLVDKFGIRPDPEKVAAFAKAERPKTFYEVRRLVGFLQFHSSLIPRLAIRMALLNYWPVSRVVRVRSHAHRTNYHANNSVPLGGQNRTQHSKTLSKR
jgi:hypothetical protein